MVLYHRTGSGPPPFLGAPDLRKVSAPTLVVVGAGDVLKPSRYSESIAREIPGAEYALIPHAGHAAL